MEFYLEFISATKQIQFESNMRWIQSRLNAHRIDLHRNDFVSGETL